MPNTPTIPYDLFISYAHRDNVQGQVRELRDAINDDFESFAGRPLKIFFDEDDIPTMAAWEQRIAKGLDESRLFLAVLSPNFFASDYCRREWEEYTRYEAMRQCLGEGVAPVYFIELPGLETGEIDELITEWVRGPRQWCDLASQTPVEIARWHERGKRALEDTHVADRLRELKSELAERLKRADRAKESPTNFHRHNPQFVGRVRELTQLRHAVSEQGSVGVVGHSQRPDAGAVAVHGVGGMGKTELALAYSHAFAWDYPGGRWLAACEHVSDFNLVLRQLAEPLGVEFTEEENKDAHLAGERILKELRQRDRSLLLLDNVDDPALLTPDVLMRLPRNVHMLATTRMGPMQLAGSPHDHTFIAVDELPMDDALALIRSHQRECRFTDQNEEAAAGELVKLLDGFTLAVETAAIYLGRRAGPGVIAAYVERLNPAELLEMSEESAADPTVAVRHKEALLERTLEITFETLSVEQMHVLTLGALLPADQIPLPWLRAVEGEGISSFASSVQGDAAWDQLRESLLSLRLFQKGEDEHVVRMHRMVQELIRKRSKDQASALDSPLVEHVKSRAKFLWEGWVHHENRWEVTPLAACSWHWMERGDGVGPYLANQAVGPLQQLARYAEAEPLVRRAKTISETSYGPDNPGDSVSLNNLSALLLATNRFDEAEPLMTRALAIEEASYGPDHPNVATSLNNLAELLQVTNRPTEAEALMRRALAIWQESLGKDHPYVASALTNLAWMLQDTNRRTDAEPLMKRAIAIDEASHGPDHPKVATGLGNLAQLLQDMNRLTEAEPLMKRALAINEASFGPAHPEVAIALSNLAELLKDTNRLAEAEPLMRRALTIKEASFGPNHPDVAIGLSNLAMLLKVTNRLEEAEPLMRQALAIWEESLGKAHPKVATALSNLATLLHDTNRFAEAEPLVRRAFAIEEASYGPDHPKVALRLNFLGLLLRHTNRHTEGEPLMRRALAIDEASYGPDHPKVATDLSTLALLLIETTRFAEAEQLMARALQIDEVSYGLNHPKVARDLNILAPVLLGTNRPTEAEPLMRRALAIWKESLGKDHMNVTIALSNLAQFLEDTNRLAEAEPFYRSALDSKERLGQADSPRFARDLNNYALLLRKLGRYEQAAERLARAIEIEDKSLPPEHPKRPHRLNNLAIALTLAGKLDQAINSNERAWSLKQQGEHDVTSGRVLLLRTVLCWLCDGDPGVPIGQLHTLLATPDLGALGNVNRVWDVEDILDALNAELQKDQMSFLRVLVDALNDPACIESLKGNTIWTGQSSVPLEAPWPGLTIEP